MTKIYVVVIDKTTGNDITQNVELVLYDGDEIIRRGITQYWNVARNKTYMLCVTDLNGDDYYMQIVAEHSDEYCYVIVRNGVDR